MTNNNYEIVSFLPVSGDPKRLEFEIERKKPASLEDVQSYISSRSGLADDIAGALGHHTFAIDRVSLLCIYGLNWHNSSANLVLSSVSMTVLVSDKR